MLFADMKVSMIEAVAPKLALGHVDLCFSILNTCLGIMDHAVDTFCYL